MLTLVQMMYLALTYDHRLLDGREAVTFLVKVCFTLPELGHVSTQRLIVFTGQGVHRRPPANATWLKRQSGMNEVES